MPMMGALEKTIMTDNEDSVKKRRTFMKRSVTTARPAKKTVKPSKMPTTGPIKLYS